MAASNILGEDSEGFDFEYSQSLEDAVAPDPLPEREYIGEIVDFKKGVSNLTGKDNFTLVIVIPVEEFPSDYNPENAPDGMRLVFFSPDVDNSRKGMWNMKQICRKLRVPLTNRVSHTDFVGKKVRVDVTQRQGQDEVMYNNIKGTPEAID